MFGRKGNRFAPLAIIGDRLSPIDYQTPVASAQVKSAILLAGCQTEGTTTVTESSASRNHTELMLEAMGASLRRNGTRTEVDGPSDLRAVDVVVPGDFSSAAYFLTGATLLPGSELVIRNVGINPTRTGFLRAMEAMGASIHLDNRRESAGEEIADLRIEPAELRAITIDGDQVPAILDELPLLAVAASQARGRTVVTGAAELRVKETDRIAAVTNELRKLGVSIEPFPDGFAVKGPSNIRGGTVDSHGDHRIAMSLRIASLLTEEPVEILNYESVAVSFPDFEERLRLVLDRAS
jgi:3-phosphoshikimate 1-carboxyvinyltransferase